MSLVSERLDYESSSTPSPDMLSKKLGADAVYRRCQYRGGNYCCGKICTLVVLIIFTTLASLAISGLTLYFDNWAGISTNPDATLDLRYPRLGPKYLDYVVFNETIPNDSGTLYQYIDEARTPVRFITSRFGLLSHCKAVIDGPRIALFKTPWRAPVCKANWDEYQCPIVAMRTMSGGEPTAPHMLESSHGCIKKSQVCDGSIDCPSGHDEMNCPTAASSCGPGMVVCSNKKPICIPKSSICDGINDCGMYEDEQSCCGGVGFIRCGDGSCVMGDRCDAKADCFDLSDEYDCPDPSSKYYAKCLDGQLIESTYQCEDKTYPSFQCNDLSDETNCNFKPKPLRNNPALKSLEFDKVANCFKQAFTFASVNDTVLGNNYPDIKQREFAGQYEFSPMRLMVVVSIGVSVGLCFIALLFLCCFGCMIKRCASMRRTFILLAVIYLLGLIQSLFTGIFWVKYVAALNEVMENPASSSIYEQVAIEMIRVTGGLASVRISTHLTFYNSGFFALGFLLSVVAAHLIKISSCHQQQSKDFTEKFRQEYLADPLASNRLLMTANSTDNSDNGIPTPEQVVSPHRAFRSLDRSFYHSASDTALRKQPVYHWSPQTGNTYISYKDTLDSIDRSERLSAYHSSQSRTLDRNTVKYTQV